jgi:DNA-binding Lrp family transcriptional regulator
MDRIDRKILALYQNDTRRIAESIGGEVGLSAAAVQRRIKRMREEGVIKSEVAIVEPRSVGVLITCIVLLTMVSKPGPVAHLSRFKREMLMLAEVQQCYHVTGTCDMVVVVTARSMEDYGEFAHRWFESSDSVMRYETLVVLDRVKAGLALSIGVE